MRTIPTDNSAREWPTREEWAESRRAFYHDRFDNLAIEFALTDEDAQWAIPALRELWKAQGKRLRALKFPPAHVAILRYVPKGARFATRQYRV